MKRTTAALIALVGILLAGLCEVEANQQDLSDNTIVPGVRVGAFTLGMSKDDVLKKLGKPELIYWGRNNYTLDNLPLRYRMNYRNIQFEIDEYVFQSHGGISWAIPYVAGVYALAVQVDPAITPERFWFLAARTGRALEIEREGKTLSLGSMIDPVRLIQSIKAAKDR